MMKKINIGVREFALPIPRTGSIEVNSGYSSLPITGQEIHRAVQAKREIEHHNYRSEVRISHTFERDDYRFVVSGQIDGIFDGSTVLIEEIKTAFDANELLQKLQADLNHPYCLQLKTYIYFYAQQSQVIPAGRFYLVSARTGDFAYLSIPFDQATYEHWLDKRLDELVAESKIKEEDEQRRKIIARTLTFPFPNPRESQMDLIQSVEEHLSTSEPILVQAPTGLGKTVGVLFPFIKEAFGRGQKVVYVTPKNSQHSVAEDAVKRFQKKTSKLRALTITAKSKICLKAEQICNPQYCQYAKDYYAKIYENDLVNKLTKHRHLNAKKFREYGEQYQVCPFELSVDSLERADIVIGDYNYVFSPRSLIGRLTTSSNAKAAKPNLIIDEAHNLPSRATDYYSASLSTYQLSDLSDQLVAVPQPWAEEARKLIERSIAIIYASKPSSGKKDAKIDLIPEAFYIQDERLRDFLSRYLKADIHIEQKDPILRFCSLWADFVGTLSFEGENFFTTYQTRTGGALIKITCCDASDKLRDAHDAFAHVIGFSATLKPFDYYARLSGLNPEKTRTVEFRSPFPKSNRKLIIIPQVSTKYADRERFYPKIADAIARITAQRLGNYFVFFPSFDFMIKVADFVNLPDFTVLRQTSEMKSQDVGSFIERLKSQSEPTVIFAVQGGVFSEGVDYPGESIIGAIIVGPGLPSYNLERELLREYYDRIYGSGFEYAYTFPAMTKVIQSAGRVIRSEQERGLIVLMDRRFTQQSYVDTMPKDWFDSSVNELVSDKILSDISAFWSNVR